MRGAGVRFGAMDLNPLTDYPDVVRVDRKNGHYYKDAEGRRVPQVTSVLSKGIPKNLTGWAARTAARKAYDLMTVGNLHGEELIEAASKAPYQHRDSAGRRGTTVHDFAEQICFGRQDAIPPDILPWAQGVIDFMDRSLVRPVAVEVVVWNDDPFYAGTVDLLSEREGGELFLVDWKTSKGVYIEMALQLAAYRYAKYMRIGQNVYKMPEITGTGIVHLPGDFTHVYYATKSDREAYETFLHAKSVGEWLGKKKEEVLNEWEITR